MSATNRARDQKRAQKRHHERQNARVRGAYKGHPAHRGTKARLLDEVDRVRQLLMMRRDEVRAGTGQD